MSQVIHHSRLAWDAARLFAVSAADDDLFGWLSREVGDLFGPEYEQTLVRSRDRLRRSVLDNRQLVEAGVWRIRLEDSLRARPEIAESLRELTVIASGLLRSRHG